MATRRSVTPASSGGLVSAQPEDRPKDQSTYHDTGQDESLIQVSLHRKRPTLGRQYQTTCISKHYALNNQILAAFESHYRKRLYKVAFYLGLNFVETALLEIPKHGYFYSDKFASTRLQSSIDALRVTLLLQNILGQQHSVDDSLARECHRLERLHYLATEQYERLTDNYEGKRASVEADLDRLYNRSRAGQSAAFCGSGSAVLGGGGGRGVAGRNGAAMDCDMVGSTLLACGESISSVFCPSSFIANHATSASGGARHRPSGSPTDPPPKGRPMSQQHEKVWEQHLRGVNQGIDPFASQQSQPPSDVGRFPPFPKSQPPPRQHVDPSDACPAPLYPSQGRLAQSSLIDEDEDDEDEDGTDYAHHDRTGKEKDPDGGGWSVHRGRCPHAEESKVAPPPPSHNDDVFRNRYDQSVRGIAAVGIPLDDDDRGGGGWLPEPPGHVRTQSDYDLQRALFLSGLEVTATTSANHLPRMSEGHEYHHEEEKTFSEQERRDEAPSPYTSMVRDDKDDTAFYKEDFVPAPPPGAKRRGSSLGVPMDMLKVYYQEDFDALLHRGRVTISQVPTYQGRVPDSTNGCTVIAPLLCIHHFHNDDNHRDDGSGSAGVGSSAAGIHGLPDAGLPDQVIVEVIDEETPNILPAVRKSLGLIQDAFLIPVDAHESLMAQHYMCREQFLTVCGGNILEEKHLEPLLEQLSIVGSSKMAATFFFHEHVITILQLRRSHETVWFDIIDSLPHPATLRKEKQSSDVSAMPLGFSSADSLFSSSRLSRSIASSHAAESSQERTSSLLNMEEKSNSARMSSGDWEDWETSSEFQMQQQEQQFLMDNLPTPQNAARIRCMDVEALKATLRWYASSVFTAENAAYIDAYQWDEKLSDFDPRVFQAFIWTEAS